MFSVKNFTVTFLIDSPVEINNRVPASPARFPQYRVMNDFASKVAKRALIVGHSKIYKLLLPVLVAFQYRHFRLSAFPFFPRNSGKCRLASALP